MQGERRKRRHLLRNATRWIVRATHTHTHASHNRHQDDGRIRSCDVARPRRPTYTNTAFEVSVKPYKVPAAELNATRATRLKHAETMARVLRADIMSGCVCECVCVSGASERESSTTNEATKRMEGMSRCQEMLYCYRILERSYRLSSPAASSSSSSSNVSCWIVVARDEARRWRRCCSLCCMKRS